MVGIIRKRKEAVCGCLATKQPTEQQPITGMICIRRKWRCIEHTLRKQFGDIIRQAMEWNPAWKR
ncbi:unnamed protein product [Heterobilharzia americana]|nr:unnamed protein product [Heterobilharzia americana]